MQAEAEIRASDDTRVVFGLEKARSELDPARGQTREPPLEFRAPLAVARDENDQVWKPPPAVVRLPATDAFLEISHRPDHDVKIFVFRPARRTDDEADGRRADAEAREQRLPEALPLGAVHRHEWRGGTVI